MTLLGIGIDMVKVSRMETIIRRWDRNFLERIFTKAEQEYCLQKKMAHVHFSGRFAVKEALLKAMGSGLRQGISWKEIETLPSATGQPRVSLSGRVRQVADEMGACDILSSITHDADYAIAQVLLQGKKRR
jgi:holo-[acyl-carrier protein] synthase